MCRSALVIVLLACPNLWAQAEARDPPAGLTRSDWSQIQRTVEESEYHASRAAKTSEAPALQAPNRRQAYRTTFRREGIEIVPQSPAGTPWRLGLSVTGYGYERDVRFLELAEPQALKERVEYHRGLVTEWYANHPGGLEQGFELQEPQPRRVGPLVVAMAVEGDLAAASDGAGVSFNDGSGKRLLRYAGLKAWDADGRPLEARLEATDREVRLIVDAQSAHFPVTVDPTFVHEAHLFGHGDPIGDQHDLAGWSVSASGNTLVVGAPVGNMPHPGSAHVFVRSGTTWTEQQKLTASDGMVEDSFGHAVAVSGDTAVIGSPWDDTPGGAFAGSAYVFVRSGTTWIEQQKLTASDGTVGDSFGRAVSVSGDTAVIGSPLDDAAGASSGSAYVFVRVGTTWSEQQKLTASDGATNDKFGNSVSISGDTVAIGAPEDDTPAGGNAGSAYVFVRAGTAWAEHQKLMAPDGTPGAWFGFSVSVAGDTALVGAIAAESAYVFVRIGMTWAQQQKLSASDGTPGDSFGGSVSISGDTAVVGAGGDDTSNGANTGSAYVFVRSGTTWSEQQKLTASDGAANDVFGFSVAVSGDTVVGGAPYDDAIGGVEAGSVHVFERAGTIWTEQRTLLAWDGMDIDLFGYSVSVSGDTVVVGSLTDSTSGGVGTGSAYVFVRSGTTWAEQQKLTASDATGEEQFGSSVSVSGETIVVGAHSDVTSNGDSGSAYVFVRSGSTWSEQQKLVASDGAAGDEFGTSVSVFGDTAVVGSYLDDTPAGLNAGSAYVFVRMGTTWTEQQKLSASDGATSDTFGSSVALSGDTAVVGAPGAGGSSSGSAYVFIRSGTTWSEQQKLTASDGAPYDYFGQSVSASGDTVVVGSPSNDSVGDAAGSAYVFVRSSTTWTEQQKLTASDGEAGDALGWAVSVSGDTVVAGANWDTTSEGNEGAAYVFVRSGSTWTEQQKLTAPDAAFQDFFGYAVAVSGDTVVVGAPADDTPEGAEAGTAHVFRLEEADLSVTKTDGQVTAVPGQPVSYTITVANAGPTVASAVTVTDMVPAAMLGATWTCAASPGSDCAASGSGNILDSVGLLLGGTVTYTLTATIDPAGTGALTNIANVWAPLELDPNPANNSATDTDILTPQADLSVSKTDFHITAVAGQPVTYTIVVANAGPSIVTGAAVTDTVPAILLGANWTCVPSPGSACASGGVGSINDAVNLLASGTATYILTGAVDPAATGTLVNTVAVSPPGGTADPNSSNNSATDTDTILVGPFVEGELTHGCSRQYDLAALPGPLADEDLFRILQRAHASYEVLLDGASGDLGSGSGPLLERLASDAVAVLQTSSAAGAGGSRTLRWMNVLDTPVADEFVRVRSAGCTTDCDAADVYRLSAWETTGFIPRFNNSGTQITVLVLQNLGDEAVDIYVRFWSGMGAPLGGPSVQTLGPRQSYVLDTSTIAPGSSGSLTVANTGRYGQLSGKAVAVEPATGFSFDTAMVVRPR